jgi:hypothetical protein
MIPLIKAVMKEDYSRVKVLLSYCNIYHAIPGPLKDPEEVKKVVYSSPVTEPPEKWSNILKLTLYYVKARYKHREKDQSVSPTGQSVAITPSETGSYAQYVNRGAPGSGYEVRDVVKPWSRPPALIYKPRNRLWQGNLCIIGDSGGKDRLILIGNPVVQEQLKDLQIFLLDLLATLPTDCTYDQSKGVDFIRQCQKNKKKVHSVDLSDATWNFPFSLQAQVLRALGGSSLLEYFELPVSDDGRLVSVEKGQAMGLNPSFPLFGLTHNLILIAICKNVGRIPVDTFRVLGDDVVIADDEVLKEYKNFLRDYEVPISESKSVSSRIVGEFAGRIIWKCQDITPIKWRKLGGSQLPALFHEYRSILGDAVYRLITDFEAYRVLGSLPKCVGGLNISGFDDHEIISARILKLRSGLVLSRRENLGLPPLKGDSISLPQGNLSPQSEAMIVRFNPAYLREMSALLNKPRVQTAYGLLPYLGHPGKVARQLGVDIPLLPSLRRGFQAPHKLYLTYVRRFFHHKRRTSRKELQDVLRESIYDFKNEKEQLSFEKRETKETKERLKFEKFCEHFIGSLLYGR